MSTERVVNMLETEKQTEAAKFQAVKNELKEAKMLRRAEGNCRVGW